MNFRRTRPIKPKLAALSSKLTEPTAKLVELSAALDDATANARALAIQSRILKHNITRLDMWRALKANRQCPK